MLKRIRSKLNGLTFYFFSVILGNVYYTIFFFCFFFHSPPPFQVITSSVSQQKGHLHISWVTSSITAF